MKKLIAKILTVLVVVALILPGCQKTEKAEPETGTVQKQPTAAQGATGPQNPMPIVTDGSVTLSVATSDNPYAAASLTQNLPVW
ncbi:MAG: hypothetical protein HPY74_16345 [Firmicutes bacterium]|nr:hypothetical protein [Bacillota bacterium]